MKCEEIRELLISEISGESDPAQQNVLQEHLQECGTCCNSFSEFSSIVKLMRQMPAAEWNEKLRIRDLIYRDQKWRGIIFGKAAVWIFALTAAITALAFSPVQWQITSSGFSLYWGPQTRENDVASELKSLREQIALLSRQNEQWRQASELRIKQLLEENNLEQQKRYWQTLEMYTNYLQLQHKADVQKIQHDIGTMYDRTGQEVEKTNELLEYVLKASATGNDLYGSE